MGFREEKCFFKRRLRVTRISATLILLLSGCFFVSSIIPNASAQVETVLSPTKFRIGEKLSYNVSFGKISDAAYVETYVVSRGKLSGKDAVEIRSKIKTLDLMSAAFFMFDESRIAFAAPDTGLPLYVSTNIHASALPKEVVSNYLTQPTSSFDLLTLIYRARESGGAGTFPLLEGDQQYNVTFQPTVAEHIKNVVGEFDTTVSVVQSDFLTANGIKELKINFTNGDDRIPVLIRFKTAKGAFRAMIAAIVQPDADIPVSTPTPTPKPSPLPGASIRPTPKPTATPAPYVENLPILPELGFLVGEQLDYRISSAGKPVATISLSARERKQFQKEDSLLLTATVTGVEDGNTAFRLGDSAKVQVDPDTLAPKWMESKFDSPLIGLNQTLTVDRRTGDFSYGAKTPADSPIGTHTLLSLAYAIRSFNLKPSKDLSNPVNDTRVAVFWESKTYIFTLRPSNSEEITVNGEKIPAQLITINTGNKELDALGLKVWLSTDERVPVKFAFGKFQAELISNTNNLHK